MQTLVNIASPITQQPQKKKKRRREEEERRRRGGEGEREGEGLLVALIGVLGHAREGVVRGGLKMIRGGFLRDHAHVESSFFLLLSLAWLSRCLWHALACAWLAFI